MPLRRTDCSGGAGALCRCSSYGDECSAVPSDDDSRDVFPQIGEPHAPSDIFAEVHAIFSEKMRRNYSLLSSSLQITLRKLNFEFFSPFQLETTVVIQPGFVEVVWRTRVDGRRHWTDTRQTLDRENILLRSVDIEQGICRGKWPLWISFTELELRNHRNLSVLPTRCCIARFEPWSCKKNLIIHFMVSFYCLFFSFSDCQLVLSLCFFHSFFSHVERSRLFTLGT